MAKTNESVKTAKITMVQAIAVALITALSGFATAWLTKQPTQKTDEGIKWLKIEGVRITNSNFPSQNVYVRVTVEMDGIRYSYPTNVVWASVGSQMATEKFPIPSGQSNSKMRFRAFLWYGNEAMQNDIITMENRDFVDLDNTNSSKVNGIYDLFRVKGGINRPVPEISVIYSITND